MSGKKTTDSTTVQLTIRFEPQMLEDAEALIDFLTNESGVPADRVKVIRTAARIGLRELEKRKAKEAARAGGTA